MVNTAPVIDDLHVRPKQILIFSSLINSIMKFMIRLHKLLRIVRVALLEIFTQRFQVFFCPANSSERGG